MTLKSSRSMNRTTGIIPSACGDSQRNGLGEDRAVLEPGQSVVRRLVVELLLELTEALDGLLQLPVLERDRGVVGTRLEQLQVVEVEFAEVAEPIRDED